MARGDRGLKGSPSSSSSIVAASRTRERPRHAEAPPFAPLPNRLAGGGVRTEQPRKDRLGKEGPRMGRKQVEGEA